MSQIEPNSPKALESGEGSDTSGDFIIEGVSQKINELRSEFERGNLKEQIKQSMAPLICLAVAAYILKPEKKDEPKKADKNSESKAPISQDSAEKAETKVQNKPESASSDQLAEATQKTEKPKPMCMSTEECKQRIDQDDNLAFLRDGATGFNEGITKILDRASAILGGGSAVKAIDKVNYQWDVHCGEKEVGKRQCARTVGNVLGFGEGSHGYMSVTQQMVPALVAGNIEKTGNPGIVFDLDQYQKGDVIVFKGGNKKTDYGHGRFSHVGIVRDVLTIEGQKFLAMQHDAENLLVDLIPVHPNDDAVKTVQKKLNNPKERQALTDTNPQLASIYEFRKDYPDQVRVANNNEKRIQRVGRIAFAIRTSELA